MDRGLGQLQCIYFVLWIVPIQSILKLKTWIFGSGPYFKFCLMTGFRMNNFNNDGCLLMTLFSSGATMEV